MNTNRICTSSAAIDSAAASPAYQAFRILQAAFIAAPILAGLGVAGLDHRKFAPYSRLLRRRVARLRSVPRRPGVGPAQSAIFSGVMRARR